MGQNEGQISLRQVEEELELHWLILASANGDRRIAGSGCVHFACG